MKNEKLMRCKIKY